jgi:polyphosphate kinase 2 (PPK2 family)
MHFYIAIAGIGPYRLWLLPATLPVERQGDIFVVFDRPWYKSVICKNTMETIHPFSPQVTSLYQRWLGKRLFSDKRL